MNKFLLFALLLCHAASASTITTMIHTIDLPLNTNEEALLYSQADGRVYRLPFQSELLPSLQKAHAQHLPVELEVKDEHYITHVKLLPALAKKDFHKKLVLAAAEYTPTVIDSRDVLNRYLKTLTDPTQFYARSQCFRRAEIWSYDLFKAENVNSMKAIVFFTPKYIREYKFDWWFHIAPFIYFNRDGVNNEVVLDKTYFPDGGVRLADWASAFMENGAKCPEIAKYQEYENPPANAYCLVRKVPMYYYNPEEVEKLDKEGIARTEFDPSDIYDAGREMWRRKW